MTPNEPKAPTARGMAPVTDALLDQMVQAIVAEVDPEQVILFGSRARGDAREDSDVDLVVVEAEPFGKDSEPVPRGGPTVQGTRRIGRSKGHPRL